MDNILIIALVSLTLSIYALVLSLSNAKRLTDLCKVLVLTIGIEAMRDAIGTLDPP